MKKVVSIFLAIALLFTFSMSVLAADTSITITDATRTYAAYQLLDVTSSLKSNHVAHEGTCPSDHFNYSYTLREDNKYVSILQELAKEQDQDAASVTVDQILAYLEANKNDMQTVADKIYRAIVKAGLASDATVTSATQTIEQGYWLFADTTGVTGGNVNSLVVLNTKGLDALTITPKTATPTITKKVLEINDSVAVVNGVDYWGKAADYDIGDDVAFKLTATLPSNLSSYEVYTLNFKDNLADGFTLNQGSIVVTATTGNTAVNLEKDTDYTISFDATGYEFVVSFADVTEIAGVTAETVFVVTYDAELTDAAVVGDDGNANVVDLVFSNNPYGATTGTISDRVNVYTYELVINKVTTENDQKIPLAGAGFTLYKQDVNGVFNEVDITVELNGDGTTFTFTGLDAGVYKLEESTVPAGYNKIADIEFEIEAEYTVDTVTALESTLGTAVAETGIITADINNSTGTILPSTGAAGTMWLIIGGTVLVVLAGVFMITRKKMSVFED